MKRRTLITTCVVALLSCRGAEGKPPDLTQVTEPASPRKPAATDVTDEAYVMPALPRARVTVSDAFGGKHPIEAEVAHTRETRTRGLMWRKSLAEGQGMIFVFPVEQPVSFWMRNTFISLDMIFITASKHVAGCVERAEPLTLTARTVGRLARYVLEVPSGFCAQRGIKAGGAVVIEGIDALTALPD